MNRKITIGTRGSKLALWQAGWVQSALQATHPSLSFQIVAIKTKGDTIHDLPLVKIGGKGLFIREIENALLEERIDLAVHSMKDMPAEMPEEFCIGAVPERENPQDVLISQKGLLLAQLPKEASIGTSSLRRGAQLLHKRPDLTILPLRGNLDTRIKKAEAGDMDAVILAAAGVKRLGFESKITEYLDEDIMLPAVGQGALCIETRKEDHAIIRIVAGLNHQQTRRVVAGERALLCRLQGGCQIPVAAHGKIQNNIFTLRGLVATIDGKVIIRDSMSGPEENSERVGVKLAERLIAMGAKQILEAMKNRANC